MFARFRNLFSKNKVDSELETSVVAAAPVLNASSKNKVNDSCEKVSKLEGLNLLKSLVETEQQSTSNEAVISSTPVVHNGNKATTSLSQEVADMLNDKLSHYNENLKTKKEVNGIHEELNGSLHTSMENQDISFNQNLSGNFYATFKETEISSIDELKNDNKKISVVPPGTEKTSEIFESLKEISEHFSNGQENENIVESNEIKAFEKICDISNLNSEFTNNKDKQPNSDGVETEKITEVVAAVSQSNEFPSGNNTKISNETSEIPISVSEHNESLNKDNKEVPMDETKLNDKNINDETLYISKIEANNPESSIKILQESSEIIQNNPNIESENDSVKEILQEIISEASKQIPEQTLYDISETNSKNAHENSPEFSETSHSSSLVSVKENNANSTTYYPSTDSDSNLYTNSSIVVEDLPSEVNTPSPTVDSTISGSSSSNTSTLDSSVLSESTDPSKIIVNPINSNILACNAITSKLSDIAVVAESLDTVIRNIQEHSQAVEVESNSSPSDKKLGTLRSTSSEDWHSRSTEDDSFATASEGNFTPHSLSSSSFQTASGRTSSYISCDKNSFDTSEADDSTYAFEMPELTSPLNMSFEGSEQSYISAQHLNGDQTKQDNEQTPTKLSESGSQTLNQLGEDQSSIADIEELHSESVTPTPQENQEYHIDSIPVESETELEVAGIVNASSMDILTETVQLPMSRTPEVSSPSTSAAFTNQQMLNNNDDATLATSNEQNTNKPNSAWRRSKYYENITKQTIKGFL